MPGAPKKGTVQMDSSFFNVSFLLERILILKAQIFDLLSALDERVKDESAPLELEG